MTASHGRAAFAFIFVTVALDMLALGIMIPVLPQLIVQLEHGNVASAASMVGVFGFTWASMQFAFSPVLGALSDHHGRRPVILLSNLGLGLDYVLMALAPNLAWLWVGRIISGITAASFATAGAYIADVTLPEGRAEKFGMLGAAFGLGFVVGPAIGGVLGGIDLRLPFWAAAGLSMTNAAYGFFILPESLPPDRRATFGWRIANPFGSMTLLRSQGLVGLALVVFVSAIAHESLTSMFVLYADYRYAWKERGIGLALAAVGVSSTIVSALLVGPAVKWLGERRVLLVGLVFGAAGFTTFAASGNDIVFFSGIPLLALWGLADPAMQGLMTRQLGPSDQGRLQGALSSLRGIAGMIGPILFTQVFAAAISDRLGVRLPGAPYYLAAALVLASVVVAARIVGRSEPATATAPPAS